MKKTSKVLIGITAGLALLLGPTAVFAKSDGKAKCEVDEVKKVKKNGKVVCKASNETETTDSFNETTEDSNNETTIKDSGNDNSTTCTVNVLAGCAEGSGVIAGGDGGVLNGLLGEDGLLNDLDLDLEDLLNDLLGDGLL